MKSSILGTALVLLKIASCEGNGMGYKISPLENLAIHPTTDSAVSNYEHSGALTFNHESIVLAKGQAHLAGALWSKARMTHPEWQLHAKIRMRGTEKMAGEGMAFWYVKEGNGMGAVMGAPDKWTGLGIILDTYDDDGRGNNPAIMGILNDGSMEYNAKHDGEGQYFAGCIRNLRNLANDKPFHLRITYMRDSLKVELDDAHEGERWVSCFEKEGIKLPAGYHFGISASTNAHPDTIELLELTVHGAELMDAPIVGNHGNVAEPKSAEESLHSSLHESTSELHEAASGPRIISNVDAKSFIETMDVLLQKQLRTFIPKIVGGTSEVAINNQATLLMSKVTALEDRIIKLNDILVNLQTLSDGINTKLSHLDTARLSDDLHHLADDLRQRVDGVRGEAKEMSMHNQRIKEMVTPRKEGFVHRMTPYFMFFVVQIGVLFVYVAMRERFAQREKKWM